MNTLNSYNFTTSPLSQPTRKLRRLENSTLRSLRFQRLSEIYNRRNLNKKIKGKSEVKELDAETGLYYYGARYLDPRTSRWLSGDPAMGEYVPSPGQDPGKLRGIGGVYNFINLHVYHYAGNNPIVIIDIDGEANWGQVLDGFLTALSGAGMIYSGTVVIGCAAAKTIGTVGLSTPVSIIVGGIGLYLFLEGMTQFSFGMGEMVAGFTNTQLPSMPTSIGGTVGAVIDVSSGHNRSSQGVGAAEAIGDNISRGAGIIAGGANVALNIYRCAPIGNHLRDTLTLSNDIRNAVEANRSTNSQPAQRGLSTNNTSVERNLNRSTSQSRNTTPALNMNHSILRRNTTPAFLNANFSIQPFLNKE